MQDDRWMSQKVLISIEVAHNVECDFLPKGFIIIQNNSKLFSIWINDCGCAGIEAPIVDDKVIKQIKASELITQHKFTFATILITSPPEPEHGAAQVKLMWAQLGSATCSLQPGI